MKYSILVVFLLFPLADVIAQPVYKTTDGEVHFNASTPLEDIDAVNTSVNAILKAENGQFAAVMLIRDFKFRRALMQEHFNENYMESETYPKGYFTGTISDLDVSGLTAAPKSFTVSGKMTIHGVTREVTANIALSLKGNQLILTSGFTVMPETYDIKVPRLIFKKIAREVAVEVRLPLEVQ